jgi:hypothetical protein
MLSQQAAAVLLLGECIFTTPSGSCLLVKWRFRILRSAEVIGTSLTRFTTSAVTITGFTVAFSLDGVLLQWTIGDSDGLVGFNVYRSSQADDRFLRINDDVIAADIGNEYLDASVRPGEIYSYRLGAVDRDGEFFSLIAEVRVPLGEVTLYQNYPNPFNPSTTIALMAATTRETR